jgi:signal transduction histidine kinase/CheY-like chemotaxis protein
MRMKVRVFLLVTLLMLAIVPILIAYSAYTQSHNPALGYRFNYAVLVPEAGAFLLFLLGLILLVHGHFTIAAHLILVTAMLTIWTVMFVDRSGVLSSMDTIVFVAGMVALTPLALTRRKWAILAYGAGNLVLLAAFALVARARFGLTRTACIEYLADNAVALTFITLVALSVFVINQRALKQLENELAERRRQEGEKERLQAQLVHAQKMESIGRLAGGVAHDFNNLLTTVMGNTSMVITKLGAENPAVPRLKDVMRAGESAAALTRQLLAFSRRQVTEPRPIDLNSHIEGIAPLLSRLIGENVRLVLKLGPGAASIMADPGQVEQIVINLVANARDAMPAGGRIVIETRRQRIDSPPPLTLPIMKPGEHVVLSVSDNGIGISADDIQHIFDPFFTTKPVGKGTGLGLALVYGSVQQNGGSIAVHSVPGEGTTMTVYFPLAGSTSRTRAPEQGPPELPGGSETVLLVEDDPAVLDFVTMVLTSLGYRVHAAADGAAALGVIGAATAGIDLLLTDFILPDMTGTTLAAQARARRASLKLLFMSGHAENIAMEEGAEGSCGQFIAKPFTAQELARKIRTVLDESS